jgi:hypothetical protein
MRTRLLAIPADGWDAWLAPVSGFNTPEQESARVHSVVAAIRDSLIDSWRLNHEAFIQLEQFEDKQARAIFAAKAREWLPEIGLGVWPDRPPPAAWTKEELSAPPGERIRPLMFNVFQISTSVAARRSAVATLFRFGSMLEVLSRGSAAWLFEQMTAVLKRPIVDPSYTCFSYYVPLLEAKSIQSATRKQLDEWCSGIDLYMRQSFEDKGVLILSRESIVPALTKLGGAPETGSRSEWSMPDSSAAP